MKKIHRGIITRALLILTVCLTFAPLTAFARATPTAVAPPALILEPVGQDGTYLTAEMQPGTKTELTVALGNAGETDIALRTFAADVYTLINGGFGINPENKPVTGTTTWLDYPAETLNLAPGTKIERTFTVTVPPDTAPGQYITGVVLQTENPIAIGESGMLQQIIAKAIAVFITVPGPLTPDLEVGKTALLQTASANTLQIEIENGGNVLLKPAGTVTMTSSAGAPVMTAPVTMDSVYAGMSTTLEIPIPSLLAPGDYLIDIVLDDAATKAHAEARAVPLTVASFSDLATPTVNPLTISSVVLDPISATNGDLQAVNITVVLSNSGTVIPNAQLTLRVMRDGALVEAFPFNSSLVVEPGETTLQQRYVPLAGWTSGGYEFTFTLEAVDHTTGQTTVLATSNPPTTLDVP